MLDFYQKRRLKIILGSRYTQVLVLLITLWVMWSAFTRYEIAVEMEGRRFNMEQEASALQAQKNALEAEVNYLSDERGIEAELRRQFDVAKDGEKVVVIVDDKSETESVEIDSEPESTNQGRWYEFWR